MRALPARFIVAAILVLPLMSFANGATAQPAASRPAIRVAGLGPQVGQPVPDFRLTDQNGKVWTRDAIMGPKGAMLVFFRSADW